MMAHGRCTTATAPAAVDIDWIWGRPRGYIVSIDSRAFGPMSFNDLGAFRAGCPCGLNDPDVALAVSRRLNGLKRGEWQRLLVRCDNWLVRW